ncbi:MAG TPA: EF-hand domain-containing protein [Bacteroides sp.]|nr:EF-hand domain-containing protein [Bacteroides sp.]
MLRSILYSVFLCILVMAPVWLAAQEIDYDSLLQRIDTVENPVYKPVVSFSYGMLNFRGDVKNSYTSAAVGNPAGRVNVATFIDRRHHFIANFNFTMGRLNGSEYAHGEIGRNLNFQTDLYAVGVNAEYRFGHILPASFLVRPYLSLGVENINFSAKGDLVDGNGETYYYWSDGTIRNVDESMPGPAAILHRDYLYETDLRKREQQEFGLGDYSQRSLAFPAGLGVHFRIHDRAFFTLGVEYHYALTDVMDNVAYKGTSIRGKQGNDSFIFSHLSLHFDLFSDPRTRTVELLYADVEFDPVLFDDEDGDFVLDVADMCPGTPFGVEVDSLGCPFDSDGDGVPDYLDREPGTAPGVWVNESGETVTEEQYLAGMQYRNEAMNREDANAYMDIIRDNYRVDPVAEIPDRFRSLDADGDGYISFDELLKTVDAYFDFELDLTLEELREVNEFFFSQ